MAAEPRRNRVKDPKWRIKILTLACTDNEHKIIRKQIADIRASESGKHGKVPSAKIVIAALKSFQAARAIAS